MGLNKTPTSQLGEVGVCIFDLKKLIYTNSEYLGKATELNVCNKSFAGFYSLYGVFIYIYTDKLHFIRKCSLRELGGIG